MWKNVLAGAAAGFAASIAMTQFQNALKAASKQQRERNRKPEDEPATVKAAEAIAKRIGIGKLDREQKKAAGLAVHYVVGTAAGALYGAISRPLPRARMGFGIVFGAAVWAVVDEMAVPALGLAKPALRYPLSTHAYALASHVVYGVATEAVSRGVRALVA